MGYEGQRKRKWTSSLFSLYRFNQIRAWITTLRTPVKRIQGTVVFSASENWTGQVFGGGSGSLISGTESLNLGPIMSCKMKHIERDDKWCLGISPKREQSDYAKCYSRVFQFVWWSGYPCLLWTPHQRSALGRGEPFNVIGHIYSC